MSKAFDRVSDFLDHAVADLDRPKHLVRWAKCCRWWPVVPYEKVGRCGLCGERPDMDDLRDEKPVES